MSIYFDAPPTLNRVIILTFKNRGSISGLHDFAYRDREQSSLRKGNLQIRELGRSITWNSSNT